MGLDMGTTWVGIGVKIGAIGIVGLETFEGAATRIDTLGRWTEVNITSLRLGLGLGGAVGISLFFAFNVQTLITVNGMSVTDWGLNIAVPALKVNISQLKISLDIAKYIKDSSFLTKAFVKSMTPEKLAKFRDIASLVYNSASEGKEGVKESKPKVAVIDIPFAGWGAELSLFATGGTVNIGGMV